MTTLEGNTMEMVHTCNCLHDSLTFKPYINSLVKKFKLRLFLLFSLEINCFYFEENTSSQCNIFCLFWLVETGDMCANDKFLLCVPFAHTEVGKRAFVFSDPSSRKRFYEEWKLNYLISLCTFKSRLRALVIVSLHCNCLL